MFLFLFVFLPVMQYRSIKKSHLGSRDLGIITTLGMMTNIKTSSVEYNDFTKGKGKFSGNKLSGVTGGGGCSGNW
jgi:hypothetical protein